MDSGFSEVSLSLLLLTPENLVTVWPVLPLLQVECMCPTFSKPGDPPLQLERKGNQAV